MCWVGICVLHLTNQAAGLRFIMSNYSQLSNCSTSIVKVKRWFSCSYLFRNVQFSWPYQECTISTEMYNSTIAEEMSVCNSSMWEFILVSRVDFFVTNQGWIGFSTQNSQKWHFRVVSSCRSRAIMQQRCFCKIKQKQKIDKWSPGLPLLAESCGFSDGKSNSHLELDQVY